MARMRSDINGTRDGLQHDGYGFMDCGIASNMYVVRRFEDFSFYSLRNCFSAAV
jgi:hypothetical protein